MRNSSRCSVNLGDVKLQNPVITASGTFGYAKEFEDAMDLNRLGGIVVKGLSLEPSCGNPNPRVIETPCGLMNAVGLENVGLAVFLKEKIPLLKELCPPVFVNIYGKKMSDYGELATALDRVPEIAGIEVNISCPNVAAGGAAFGVDPVQAAEVVSAVKKRTAKHVMVKLSPNVTDITEIARAVEAGGADSVSLINTLTGMLIDVETRRPRLANITGGLSGPAIKPVALRMVWQVAGVVKIPVVGIGGITTAGDALEFLIAGASAVQVGTASLVNPRATLGIIDGIEKYMRKKGIANLSEIVGTLET